MNIELDRAQEHEIRTLARESGRSVGEVLRELVDKALRGERTHHPSAEDDETVVHRQRDAWEKLHTELMALPVSETAKGFSGADHDEVLYGWKK